MKIIQAIGVLTQFYAWPAFAASFQNLDFESAVLPVIPNGQFGGDVAISAGLPGWTAFAGTNQLAQVLQNNITLGTAAVDILGPDWGSSHGLAIIEGQYTAVLQAGQFNGDVAATIEQAGLVPAGTKSLQLKLGPNALDFEVSLGGEDIAMVPLTVTANYTLYGADLPVSFDGQTELLSISALSVLADFRTFNTIAVDSIVFSPSEIPEPGTWALLLCGAGVFVWRRGRAGQAPSRK